MAGASGWFSGFFIEEKKKESSVTAQGAAPGIVGGGGVVNLLAWILPPSESLLVTSVCAGEAVTGKTGSVSYRWNRWPGSRGSWWLCGHELVGGLFQRAGNWYRKTFATNEEDEVGVDCSCTAAFPGV